jgi:glycosyltransferase involved in cell wall biosynthesis
MKNITILHCSETLSVSGCCRVMEHLAKNMDRTRFTSMFCAESGEPNYLEYLRQENIETHLIPNTLPKIKKPFVAILHRAGNNTPFWGKLIPQLREAGAAAIIERNIFGYPDQRNDRQLDRICANSLNTIWHHWRQSGKPDINHYLARHRVLYNAVSFEPNESELQTLRHKWRVKLGISDDAFVLGIITRPDAQKIDALMLGLIPHLKKTIPNLVLVTRRYPEVLAKPLKLMLGDRYHNLPVSADPEMLKATYALIDVCGNFPSIGESFGMAVAEAMRSYKPVIALDLPQKNKGNSQRELVEHGLTGYLGKTAADIATLLEILSKDKALCEKMGKAARQKMTNAPFGLSSVIAQFESEILQQLGEPATVPMQPDKATIRHYLETYPKRFGDVILTPESHFSIPVSATRLIWKVVRRFI